MTDLVYLAKDEPQNVKPKRPELEVEVGVDQNLPFTNAYRDAWEVFSDSEVSIKQLVAMRRTDGQARALYRLVTLPIRAALRSAKFLPAEGGEKERDFIEQMFMLPPSSGGMVETIQTVVAQILLGTFDGFSAFEQVYWAPKFGPLKGKWTLKKLAHRPAETITFLTDDHGNFDGFRQRAYLHGKVIDDKIDPENCFYFSCQGEEKKFYGVSLFESAFYHWDMKRKIYFLAHLAATRAAVGTRIGTVPTNASTAEKAKFNAALAQLGVAQVISKPEGWLIDSLKESGSFDFLGYVNHHNSQMSKSILAGWFDETQGGGQDTTIVDFGSQSDAMYMLMLQTIMDDIATVINDKIVTKFIDWNFGGYKYPRFAWGQLTEEQKNAVQKVFEKLATAGESSLVNEEFMFELEKLMSDQLGLDIDYAEVEKRIADEKAAAAAAQAPVGPDGQSLPPDGSGGAPTAGGDGGGGSDAVLPGDIAAALGFTKTQDTYAKIGITDLARELLKESSGFNADEFKL